MWMWYDEETLIQLIISIPIRGIADKIDHNQKFKKEN